MNRDVIILQKLATHLSARPQSGSGSDIDRLVVALLRTSEELHEEDTQQLKKDGKLVGGEALQLRQALEVLLLNSQSASFLYRSTVASAFESIPTNESEAYLKQQGGSVEAHCLRTGITRVLSHLDPSAHVQKYDLMRLFEEISPSDSNFYPGRGYTSDRYRTRQ